MKVISYGAAIAAAIAIGLIGSGGTAQISLSAASLSFGSQNIASGPTASQTLTVSNPGDGTLVFTAALTGPNASEFILINGCGTAIGAGSSCGLVIAFDPATAIADTASVTITDNAAGSPHTVALDGTGTSSGAGPTTAHVFVSSAGNDATCVRNAALVTYAVALAASPTNVCATGPKAYTKSNLGDTVLTETMTVTSVWNFTAGLSKAGGTPGSCNYNYGGAPNFSQCITIEPDVGQSLTFNVPANNVAAITSCVSYLSVQYFTVIPTTYNTVSGSTPITVTNAGVTVGPGSACGGQPHDSYFAHFDTPQNNIVSGAVNIWFNLGLSHGVLGNPWQMGGQASSASVATSVGVNHSGIDHVTFFDFTITPPQHFECIHMDAAGDYNTVADSIFEGCPAYGIRVEAEGALPMSGDQQTHHLIENNWFDSSATSGGINFDCNNNNCTYSDNIVRFNSFSGTDFRPTNDCAISGTLVCNVSNNRFYGNIDTGTCPSNAPRFGNTWIEDHNIWGGATTVGTICSTGTASLYGQTITYVSPGNPNYNLDLSGSQAATGFVPVAVSGGWPAGNIHDVARSGGVTNAGAS